MTTHHNRQMMAFGALEAAARVMPSAVWLITRNRHVKEAMKREYGGTIEPGRWVLRSPRQRIKLLSEWREWTPSRGEEIDAALRALGVEDW